MKEYDFVVIGSGIAGLTFALKAAKHGSVAVITKRKGADSNTAWAQGGIACVISDEDSFELHVRDTLEAGAGLCDEAAVRTIVTEGPDRIRELIKLGLQFDEREVSGQRELDLGREGGHSKRRVLHVRDVTGKEIENTLLRELNRQPHVELLENHMAVDLITAGKLGFATEDRCLGIYVLDEWRGYRVARRRSDREHGVRSVSPHMPISRQSEIVFDFGSRPWRRRRSAQQSRGGLHETLPSPWFTCAQGHRSTRHRRGDQTARCTVRLFRYHAPGTRILAGAFSTHLPNVFAVWDRYVEAADTRGAGRALPMWWN